MDSGLALRAPRKDTLRTERILVARPSAQQDAGVKID
jgi:hypothetical protein